MSTQRQALLCLIVFFAAGFLVAQSPDGQSAPSAKVTSHNGEIELFAADGARNDLRYAVRFHGKPLLAPSILGLEFAGQAALGPGIRKSDEHMDTLDQSYAIPVGKTREVRDHYNGLRVDFADPSGRKLTIEARASTTARPFATWSQSSRG